MGISVVKRSNISFHSALWKDVPNELKSEINSIMDFYFIGIKRKK